MTSSTQELPFMNAKAMLLAAFVHFVLGGTWYAPPPMFGNYFMDLAFEPGKKPKPDSRAMISAVFATLVYAPVVCLLLSCLDVRNANEGCVWGLLLAIFNAGLQIPHGFFEERPFGLYVLHQGYHTVSLMITGSLLGFFFGS